MAGSYYTGCADADYTPHFLDSCFLCQRTISHNSDIFMYRGDTPFCSQECRQEQIEMDEANERKWKKNSSSSKRSNTVRSKNNESTTTKGSDANKAVAVA